MPTVLIRIPEERADQLRAIAKFKDKPVTEVIGELIGLAVKDDPDLASIVNRAGSFQVEWLPDGKCHFVAEGIGDFTWDRDTAVGVADNIDRLASPKCKSASFLNMDAGLTLYRRGPAIRIENTGTKEGRAFSRSVAMEIAVHLFSEE